MRVRWSPPLVSDWDLPRGGGGVRRDSRTEVAWGRPGGRRFVLEGFDECHSRHLAVGPAVVDWTWTTYS